MISARTQAQRSAVGNTINVDTTFLFEVVSYMVKKLDREIELIGSSPDDRRAAREPFLLYFHEATFAYTT